MPDPTISLAIVSFFLETYGMLLLVMFPALLIRKLIV